MKIFENTGKPMFSHIPTYFCNMFSFFLKHSPGKFEESPVMAMQLISYHAPFGPGDAPPNLKIYVISASGMILVCADPVYNMCKKGTQQNFALD